MIAVALNDISLNATLKLSKDVAPLAKPSLLAAVFDDLPSAVNLIRS